ncbi:MAG TPA: ComEC/Rec2 family competence protein [Flavitalea sp.]|nr:ComEC/Rec2 family competence protein [Flavitalea sp.]
MPFWIATPFLRLLFPFVAGIFCGYYLLPPPWAGWTWIGISMVFLLIAERLSLRHQFALAVSRGLAIQLLVAGLGSFITTAQDPRHVISIIDDVHAQNLVYLLRVNETPLEKKASWKAEASILATSSCRELPGPVLKVLLYFRKPVADDSVRMTKIHLPHEGEKILVTRRLSPIANSPGLGSFDYKKYCALQHIHYQVFLAPGEYGTTGLGQASHLTRILDLVRNRVLNILRLYIPGKKEAGLAEALMIGYKGDLDKTLVQSYSLTGVVHIIAISGLHLGLIYALLRRLTLGLGKRLRGRVCRALLILGCLWAFSIMAGGSPSVLRSAVMFSFLVTGEILHRKSLVLNSLAASAFVLLWHEPYWLWDIGFQLSYTALAGIILFNKPLYQLFRPRSKILDGIWKLNAVTLSAQLLTTPISIYHFHQFPLLFLFTNFIAVPLSSIILSGEILLCVISIVPWLAQFIGKMLGLLISWMNGIIGYTGGLPFSTLKNITLAANQVLIVYVIITLLALWLLHRDKRFLPLALVSAICFFISKL